MKHVLWGFWWFFRCRRNSSLMCAQEKSVHTTLKLFSLSCTIYCEHLLVIEKYWCTHQKLWWTLVFFSKTQVNSLRVRVIVGTYATQTQVNSMRVLVYFSTWDIHPHNPEGGVLRKIQNFKKKISFYFSQGDFPGTIFTLIPIPGSMSQDINQQNRRRNLFVRFQEISQYFFKMNVFFLEREELKAS